MTNMSDQTLWRDLAPLMNPRSVAIVGASQRGSSALGREPRGNRVIRNLKNFGYPGCIIAINPKYSEVMDCPCFPDLASVPEPPDCVVLAVPNRHVPELLESAADAGVRGAVVFAAGFAETGPEGRERQARLEALSKARDLLICGPNCYGVLNVFAKAPLFASTIPSGFLAGPVGFVSQSGGLSTTIANALMLNRHVGLSHIVSCGNQAGVTVEEYLNYFVEDPNTTVVAAFVEGFKQPLKLLAVAKKATQQKKPLIILKGGRSEVSKRAAATHSGSLAGSADVIDAAFRQSGIVHVRSINELIDTISVFSCEGFMKRYRGGRRIGVLSGSGGECTLVSDAASAAGLQVPELSESTRTALADGLPDFGNLNNPLDGTGAMYDEPTIFPRLLGGLINDPNIDIIAVNLEANDPRPKELKSGNRFAQAVENAAGDSRKPMMVFSSVVGGPVDPDILTALRSAGVPLAEGAECATAALRNLAGYDEFSKARPAPQTDRPIAEHARLSSGILPVHSAFRLLADFSIPAAKTVLAHDIDEAVAAASDIGFPVALKIESPDIQHKSDVGGVILGAADAAAVRAGFARIQAEITAKLPRAKISGIAVQQMSPDGLEMILGIKRDPLFGPIVICGFGGIFVEILKDVAIGIPPLSAEQARTMVRTLRGWPLLAGVRGKPAVDLAALVDAIIGVSKLAISLRDQILGLDINPLMVHSGGVLAVDALVHVR